MAIKRTGERGGWDQTLSLNVSAYGLLFRLSRKDLVGPTVLATQGVNRLP